MNKAKIKRFMKKHADKYRNEFDELDVVDLTWLVLDEFKLDFDQHEADIMEIALDLE